MSCNKLGNDSSIYLDLLKRQCVHFKVLQYQSLCEIRLQDFEINSNEETKKNSASKRLVIKCVKKIFLIFQSIIRSADSTDVLQACVYSPSFVSSSLIKGYLVWYFSNLLARVHQCQLSYRAYLCFSTQCKVHTTVSQNL